MKKGEVEFESDAHSSFVPQKERSFAFQTLGKREEVFTLQLIRIQYYYILCSLLYLLKITIKFYFYPKKSITPYYIETIE